MLFGDRLKMLRDNKNITQKELGAAVGVSDRVIGYYESNDRFPKDENILKKIADFFNVSVDYLLGRTENNKEKLEEIPEQFTDPNQARTYVRKHKIFASEGFNPDRIDDEKILEFANALLEQMKLVGYKYKK